MSLELQREKTRELAEDHGVDDVHTLDLGVHTGFSIHFKPQDEERIDSNERVREELENIREGTYDYIIAQDDTRLGRDHYFWTWVRMAEYGGADFLFVDDVPPIDSLEFVVMRPVEQKMKMKEIKKVRQAVEKRQEKGYDEGRPPAGFTYDSEGQYIVPDEDFEEVVKAIEMKDGGATYDEILDEVDVLSRATLSKVLNERRELYEKHADSVGGEDDG
jgi:hypothetical protein